MLVSKLPERYEREDKDGYTSHYDPNVNVCYVRIHSIEKPLTFTDVVSDAFGGRVYANYLWTNPQGKKYWEVSPLLCVISIPDKRDEICKTDTEFDEQVEKYFGVPK